MARQTETVTPLGPVRFIERSRFLSRLPPLVLERFRPHLEMVHLRPGVLAHAGTPIDGVYFPLTATLVSCEMRLSDGDIVSVGLIGARGVVGSWAALGQNVMPCDKMVRVEGDAVRLAVGLVREEVERSPEVRALFVRQAKANSYRAMQTAACLAYHSAEARCATLLLRIFDLIGADRSIPLGHERLSEMIGTSRPTVSLVLSDFQKSGLIETTRQHILLHKRLDLQVRACECYNRLRNFDVALGIGS